MKGGANQWLNIAKYFQCNVPKINATAVGLSHGPNEEPFT